jgi:glyoxylase-like metal-dependent hydrolase (beta-lactamase superfamily II)
MRLHQIGAITVDKVIEFEFWFDPSEAFPDYDVDVARTHRDWLAPDFFDFGQMKIRSSVHSYILRTGKYCILVDTCVGNDRDRIQPMWHQQNRNYLENLAKAGVKPEAVDFVMCTHLHGDHVGWNTRLEGGRWVPTFPNARYIFSKADYDYFNAARPGDRHYPPMADAVRPIVEAGQASIVGNDFAIDDSVAIHPSPGHTPGHYCVHLTSAGKQAMLTGDLMHHPIQVNRPDWSSRFCFDPDHSRRTRQRFVEDHADRDVVIFAAHFPGPTAGRIVGTERGTIFRVTRP